MLYRTIMILVLTAMTLSACGTLRKIAGDDKNPPDEFKIVEKPPLIMPPDYNLRPPRPGAPEAQDLQPAISIEQILASGDFTVPLPASPGELALLKVLIQGRPTANVRSNAGAETTVVEKGTLLSDILKSGERLNGPDGSRVERVRSVPLDIRNN